MPGSFISLLRDRKGSVSLLFAAAIFVLFGFGAMAIDVGSFFYEKRRQQTANDLAALAAAGDLPRARAAAQASASSNGFTAANVQTVQHGIYKADPATPPERRFTSGPATTANAVKVEMRAVTSMIFGRVLLAAPSSTPRTDSPPSSLQASLDSGEVPIGSSAIAAQDAQAAFAVGSRLVKLEGGILNGLLGSLLGGSISLSVMDYEALVKARVDLFDFSKRLATRVNLTAVTYDDVLKANVRLGDVLAAVLDAARDNPTSTGAANNALAQIAQSRSGASQLVDLGQLVSFGSFGDKALTGPKPIAASLSALDMVSAIAQISNGRGRSMSRWH
jgi:uncharacterized membrane protein